VMPIEPFLPVHWPTREELEHRCGYSSLQLQAM
jgi:hypothetical protein